MNLLCCCTMAPNTRVTRKWELFAGRNRFYCDGLLMSAPHTGVFYLTCFLITGTSALFFAFDCPYLATRITPAIPIVGAILYFFTMSSLLRTTFTDPGVIPRASHDEAAYIEKQIEVPNSLNSPTYRPPPRTKEVLVKGQTVKLKYCFTCKIFRPPRASHCSLCDNCVDRFDHHCPWVGNCVGKRNYRFFYMFLVSLAFLAVFIFSCSITHLVLLLKKEKEVFEVIKTAPSSVIVTFICFFSIWSVIGLAGFHTYLTTSDQTTNEDLKGSFSSKGGQRAVNPYSRGNICLNCFHILCGPMTPSLIDRRGVVTDEYILQMQHGGHQNNQLTEVTSTVPSTLVTSQPIIGQGDNIMSVKQRLFDDSNPSTGIYRHRSYDNLQNGNSNSLAQLVDNEIPLSTIEGPVIVNENNSIMTPSTLDDDNMEMINKRLNNLSGSYNNLFRENLDNSFEKDDMQLKNNQISSQNVNNVHDFSPIGVTILSKSASESENVYSNVPNSNISSSVVSSNDSNRSDPNLHVYSNLIEEQQQQQKQQQKFEVKNVKKPHNEIVMSMPNSVSNLTASSSNEEDLICDTTDVISSALLSDDLDMDDPVSAFVANNRKKYASLRKTNTRKSRGDSGGKESSIPVVSLPDVKPITVGVVVGNSSTNQTPMNSPPREGSNFMSSSRLRLLQDTTMIDTALDLDSLDGSSIGNNSQACLVKTAIV